MFHKNWDLLWRSEAGDEEVLLDSLEDHARRNVHKEVAVQLNNSGNRAVQRVKLVRANVLRTSLLYCRSHKAQKETLPYSGKERLATRG